MGNYALVRQPTVQFTCALHAIALVGWGLPPAGSSVSASMAISFIGIFTGATMAIWPCESGWKIATLMGLPFFETDHSCSVSAAGMAGVFLQGVGTPMCG